MIFICQPNLPFRDKCHMLMVYNLWLCFYRFFNVFICCWIWFACVSLQVFAPLFTKIFSVWEYCTSGFCIDLLESGLWFLKSCSVFIEFGICVTLTFPREFILFYFLILFLVDIQYCISFWCTT